MKRHIITFFLSVALLASMTSPASGQERLDSLTLKTFFRQDVSILEPSFRNNSARLQSFVYEMRSIMADSTFHLEDIVIHSSASPEGPFYHNIELSQNRGKALRSYLINSLGLSESVFRIEAVGEDWEGLLRLVRQYEVPDKDEVIRILEDHADFVHGRPTSEAGSPKKQLMSLHGGRTWNWLLEHIYPELRSAGNTVVSHFYRYDQPLVPLPKPGRIIDTILVIQDCPPGYPVVVGEPAVGTRSVKSVPRQAGPYRFALKSNLLYDALTALNFEIEFPIGQKYSVMLEHNFPWWVFNSNRLAVEYLNTSLEARMWMGDRSWRSELTGWYVGLYGGGTKMDLELSSKGRQYPYTWQAGVTAGYSIPLGKRDNWRLELGIGLGVMPYKYDYYERSDKKATEGLLMYKRSGKGTWIGPTKLKCSLVWMIPLKK